MPRRHPRAVYEVYDADEALGGQSESADRPNRQEAPEIAEQPVEQATPYEDSESSRTLSELPIRGALTRMLAGAMLCVAAVCVVAAIAIVLLHVVSGVGSGRRRSAPAPAPQAARALHGGASSTAAASVPMAHEVPHPRVAAVANAIRGGHPSPSPTAATARALAAISVATTLSIARSAPSIRALPPALQFTSDATPGCECTPAEAEFGFER